MKIALPTAGNEVDSHFGHCEYFMVFTTNDKKELLKIARTTLEEYIRNKKTPEINASGFSSTLKASFCATDAKSKVSVLGAGSRMVPPLSRLPPSSTWKVQAGWGTPGSHVIINLPAAISSSQPPTGPRNNRAVGLSGAAVPPPRGRARA